MIGLAATASYLPERWMTAAEIADASSIPEQVILEKFGLRGKHIAAADEHVSDMAVEAASRLLGQHDLDPAEVDVVLYYGSLWKDYPVWQAAPWIAHRLGCENAYAWSTPTCPAARRSRCGWRGTSCSPSRSCATC